MAFLGGYSTEIIFRILKGVMADIDSWGANLAEPSKKTLMLLNIRGEPEVNLLQTM